MKDYTYFKTICDRFDATGRPVPLDMDKDITRAYKLYRLTQSEYEELIQHHRACVKAYFRRLGEIRERDRELRLERKLERERKRARR